ncbi:terminase [Pseudonocardia pini]|uniref:terminase n=1 Tax=Pseudonocardia pini TaxID=2758030 RepID=UPI0015F008A0|nr:terminase [Pseudonocardia pini]
MTALLDAPEVMGKEEPRLWTRPLRDLTPDTTLGYQAIRFATEILGVELLPWQRFWLLHALELLPDGSFRFRTILTLVARQQGKTTLLKIVSLWAMYMGHAQLVLGAAQSLDIARESWQGAVELAEDNDELAPEVANIRRANGEQCLTLRDGSRYRITAATRGAGRGLSVDLLVLDELREHRDWAAWGALTKTTIARPNAITVGISNAGDDQSVVLNSLRAAAIAGSDERLGLFEWSAPDGCDLDDLDAIAQACPGLGRTITLSAILSAKATDPPAVFRTELLCQHVETLDSAIDMAAWRACEDTVTSLGQHRDRVAVCLDVAPDGQHATLAGAALLPDGRVRVEILKAWDSTTAARAEVVPLLQQIRPADVGWFPNGPAAELGPELRQFRRTGRLDVAKVVDGRVVDTWEEEAARLAGAMEREACQGLAGLVEGRQLAQPNDPLLNAHVAGSTKYETGDGWRFLRKGAGHVDALYAAAGAVYLARMLPPPAPIPIPRIF